MFRWTRVVPFAGVVVLLTAACGDNPQTATLSDPAAVTSDLNAANDVFETPTFKSFSAMSGMLKSNPPGSAAALAATTAPSAALLDDRPSVRAALAARDLAHLAPLYSVTAPQDSFLPDSILGTYEWNVQTAAYEKTARPGAPANTIRIILYAIDPITNLPIVPLDEVGYVDFTDNQTPGVGGSLGIAVRDSAGTTTYLDYDVTVTANPSGFGANSTGFVANGQGRRLDFSVQFLATGNDTQGTVSVDATVQVNTPDVGAEVHDAVSFTATTVNITRDFRVHRGSETIRITGTLLITETAPQTFSVTISVTVTVNGGVFVTIQGTDQGITVTKADGTEHTAAERAALARLLEAADDFLDDLGDLFEPVEILTGT